MKRILKSLFSGGGLLVWLILSSLTVTAQKVKPRISLDYVNNVGVERFIKASVKYRGEDGVLPAPSTTLNVYSEFVEDSLVAIGTVETNMQGEAKFIIPEELIAADSASFQYVFHVKVEQSDLLKTGSKSVKFLDASVEAEIVDIDSVVTVRARVIDAAGDPLGDEKVSVAVDRLFAPLTIGESSYRTDENGIILVPMKKPLPGIDGNLEFIITMEGRKFGTVQKVLHEQVGTPIVDISTFDDRTMWGPPNKTPWFLLIFPNLLILGMWIVIFTLVFNLYRISKL